MREASRKRQLLASSELSWASEVFLGRRHNDDLHPATHSGEAIKLIGTGLSPALAVI
jgi:hypothetical protein